MNNKHKDSNNLTRDLIIVVISLAGAVFLAKSRGLEDLLDKFRGLSFFGSLLAGMFFVSVFTVAPAAVILGEMAQSGSIFWVAFFGGVGALIGDLLIFRFVKDNLTEDIKSLLGKTKRKRLADFFKLRIFRWLMPFIGALIVASPFPDELGLALMGFSKLKLKIFIPLSLALNFLGILVIGLAAQKLRN